MTEKLMYFPTWKCEKTEDNSRKPANIDSLKTRAFKWAKKEQEHFCPKIENVKVVGLEKRPDRYESHVAFFVNEDETEALIRSYWPAENLVKYRKLHNFDELKQEHPELLQHYLENGCYAYTRAEEKFYFRRKYGKEN